MNRKVPMPPKKIYPRSFQDCLDEAMHCSDENHVVTKMVREQDKRHLGQIALQHMADIHAMRGLPAEEIARVALAKASVVNHIQKSVQGEGYEYIHTGSKFDSKGFEVVSATNGLETTYKAAGGATEARDASEMGCPPGREGKNTIHLTGILRDHNGAPL